MPDVTNQVPKTVFLLRAQVKILMQRRQDDLASILNMTDTIENLERQLRNIPAVLYPPRSEDE